MKHGAFKKLAAATVLGACFGFLISWGQFTDPDRIRQMLLLQDLYLYLMMFSAIAVGFVGVRLLRRRGASAFFTGETISWVTERPHANHVAGGVIFGLGWAIADTCPAPVAGQLAQGVGWALFTVAGVFIGIELYLRRQAAPDAKRRSRRAARPAPTSAQPRTSAASGN